ncbi:hypothetical protein N7468_001181 [Penicillium chermesinum]|uniref:PH domain-containing protein n=1 Tax=Penicillium chermesinum TaxID=63820 RepID=A0A9W9PG33_9EURO|nr:uncharacterized protein N7468_001181 [Penicillium chermesinum]KAJ5246198.1 hypothetical protein N7468_001181 [Penicillium chermesinum]KAJ6144486.1 hypothetical protein N7470_008381 [Penicillium chermesinum]
MSAAISRPSLAGPSGASNPRLQPIPVSRNGQATLDTFSPVNENGSFEFDRVIKSGRVLRRVKHKHVFRASWKPAYLVLRPNLLSVYKDEETTRLRVAITLSDVTAVAPVKSPPLTSSISLSERDADEWISRIRSESPSDETDPTFLSLATAVNPPKIQKQLVEDTTDHSDFDITGRPSSPELGRSLPPSSHSRASKPPYIQDYSGNEMTSFSELSDYTPPTRGSYLRSVPSNQTLSVSAPEDAPDKPASLPRDPSRQSDLGVLRDPARVICQGYLQGLRIKGTVRQWKRLWVVLRPKNLAFYKDDSEYSALRIISMSQVIDAAEIDPLSRSKTFCLQIIAEEKTYRLCAPDEESLARWLGALKSIIVARKKASVSAGSATSPPSAS